MLLTLIKPNIIEPSFAKRNRQLNKIKRNQIHNRVPYCLWANYRVEESSCWPNIHGMLSNKIDLPSLSFVANKRRIMIHWCTAVMRVPCEVHDWANWVPNWAFILPFIHVTTPFDQVVPIVELETRKIDILTHPSSDNRQPANGPIQMSARYCSSITNQHCSWRNSTLWSQIERW